MESVMVMNPARLYTPEEYLTFELASPDKHEYIDGCILGMAGAADAHCLITMNVGGELRNQLHDRPCQVYSPDLRVKSTATGAYTYPDVTVLCGEPEFERPSDTALSPIVIVEVLSPSTEMYDRNIKFAHYMRIETLREYVLVAQHIPRVEVFTRQDDNTWWHSSASGTHTEIPLDSIGCTLSLAEVYHRVVFPPVMLRDAVA
jgi:Uma2 family endonuclease